MNVTVTLLDGTVVSGEYVGAQDGHLYLVADGEVHRIDQKNLLNYRGDRDE